MTTKPPAHTIEKPNGGHAQKPLNGKAYGSIPHLPGSRLGPGDHHCHEGQARICTIKTRDRHDTVIVQEKLDGSCVSVALIDGVLWPLTRAGYHANTSPYEQHHLFAVWAFENAARFRAILNDGERIVGEWLAQAHGTRYDLWHEPFSPFDIISGGVRCPYEVFNSRTGKGGFVSPHVLHIGGAYSIEAALADIQVSSHGAIDPVEGAVWRVERRGAVDFLAKYVRSDKVDGMYLPEISGKEAVWNWRP